MEQDTVLKEILNALNLDKKMDTLKTELISKFDGLENRFDGLENRFGGLESCTDGLEKRVEEGFARDQQFDHLGKKVDGIRVELNETQETVDFSATKIIEHEKKLRHINMQQN
ncbi:hypothetical protein [Oceanobacillus sp. CF4.6]|uniref:hypothetical protein n=1 Tax=Oceanobacillus sp. CF4.6 TaxID=3373080 RepID=UPI003EE79518